MTELAEPPFRHAAVYRTARGSALSDNRSRHPAYPGGNAVLAAPLRVSALLRARPIEELAASDATGGDDAARDDAARDDTGRDDAAGVYDARRYSEPND